jgi:hypothetical protein
MATPPRPDQAPIARARSAGVNDASRIARLPGALNAAFLASRPATAATAEELAAVLTGGQDPHPGAPDGLALCAHTSGRPAVRRPAGRRRAHRRGHPGVLPPVRWRGRLLAEGGIADNTPVSHAVALGARRIYVLPTQNPGDRGLPRPPRAALAAAVHAVTVLTNARLHGDLARYAPSAELIVLPAANPGHIPPTDFGHAGQLITRALAAARTALATGTPNTPPSNASGPFTSGTSSTAQSSTARHYRRPSRTRLRPRRTPSGSSPLPTRLTGTASPIPPTARRIPLPTATP